MNHQTIYTLLAAGLIGLAVTDFLITWCWEKRWRKRLHEASEQTVKLFSEKAALELELERKDNSIHKLEKELKEAKEKLKKAHEKVAVLMAEYERLTKLTKNK